MAQGVDDFDGITQPYNDQPWTVDHPNTDFNTPDVGPGSALGTGDMRRKYNFGNSYTTLAAKRDPFLHLLNRIKGGKVATDDPKFKFTTRRGCGPQHRYGYVVGGEEIGNSEYADQAAANTGYLGFTDSLVAASGAFSASTVIAVGDQLILKVVGDYLYGGNRRNAYGNANQFAGTPIAAGADDTAPRAFLKDQLIKVPMKAAAADAGTNDWMVCKLNWTPEIDSTNQAFVLLSACVVKTVSTATNLTCASFIPGAISSVHDKTPTFLEACRTYPIGSAYHELSGYGESWKDQPWSTDYGFCQIFKTTMMMSNRAQSTVLKYEPSEWKRVWGGKLQEHAWDVAQAGYFGVQSEDANGVTYTQGAVDYIINNGNQFAWNTTYTVDDFMDDMSVYKDPRTDLGGQIAYFCNSEVWNWMQKQGGYLKNNSEISTNFEFQLAGRGIAKGVPFSKISTVYGDLNLIRDVHLDGTNIKMLGVNLNGCRLRPLIGNGKNRDTTVYVGVKTIENSGEDYRVDLIQTDIGYEFSQPETHAIWL